MIVNFAVDFNETISNRIRGSKENNTKNFQREFYHLGVYETER